MSATDIELASRNERVDGVKQRNYTSLATLVMCVAGILLTAAVLSQSAFSASRGTLTAELQQSKNFLNFHTFQDIAEALLSNPDFVEIVKEKMEKKPMLSSRKLYGNAMKGKVFFMECKPKVSKKEEETKFVKVTKFFGRAKDWVEGIAIYCGKDSTPKGLIGGDGAYPVPVPACAAGYTEMEVSYSDEYIGRIEPICEGIKQLAIGRNRIEEPTTALDQCGEGEFITGVFGTADQTLRSIGFLCEEKVLKQPQDKESQDK